MESTEGIRTHSKKKGAKYQKLDSPVELKSFTFTEKDNDETVTLVTLVTQICNQIDDQDTNINELLRLSENQQYIPTDKFWECLEENLLVMPYALQGKESATRKNVEIYIEGKSLSDLDSEENSDPFIDLQDTH